MDEGLSCHYLLASDKIYSSLEAQSLDWSIFFVGANFLFGYSGQIRPHCRFGDVCLGLSLMANELEKHNMTGVGNQQRAGKPSWKR